MRCSERPDPRRFGEPDSPRLAHSWTEATIKLLRYAAAVLAVILVTVSPALAQHWHGFVLAGGSSDNEGWKDPILGGGALVELGESGVFLGGAGDATAKRGYPSGRGGMLAQVSLNRRSAIQPFVIGGPAAGPTVGAGIDFWAGSGKRGFRIAVQDTIGRSASDSPSTTVHQWSVQVGAVWR